MASGTAGVVALTMTGSSSGIGGVARGSLGGLVVGALLETIGGWGGGREGMSPAVGGFGATRWGTIVGDNTGTGEFCEAFGGGGAARGFSKLPSWFWGKRGLVAEAGLMPSGYSPCRGIA